MAARRPVEIGDVFELDDCPTLGGGEARRRPVIVIDAEATDEPVMVVGVTTDLSDPTRVELPNTQDEPGAATGLSQRCGAIPRWLILVDWSKLRPENRIGSLPKVTLELLVRALEELR